MQETRLFFASFLDIKEEKIAISPIFPKQANKHQRLQMPTSRNQQTPSCRNE